MAWLAPKSCSSLLMYGSCKYAARAILLGERGEMELEIHTAWTKHRVTEDPLVYECPCCGVHNGVEMYARSAWYFCEDCEFETGMRDDPTQKINEHIWRG